MFQIGDVSCQLFLDAAMRTKERIEKKKKKLTLLIFPVKKFPCKKA